jgi:hypothetical protein
VARPKSQESLPDYFILREELRKSGDYHQSNKIVYLEKPVAGQLKVTTGLPEDYLHGNRWIEVYFSVGGNWNMDFVTTLEVDLVNGRFNNILPVHSEGMGVNGNEFVFVDVAKPVELPESMRLEGIPTIVRLKRLDNSNGIRADAISQAVESLPTSAIVPLQDRKLNVLIGEFGVEARQLPRQLVETGTETITKVSDRHTNLERDFSKFYANDVQTIFNIILRHNGIGFIAKKSVEFPIKFVEVSLRPCGFHFKMGQPIHSE